MSRTIQLTKGFVAIVDDGDFERVSRWSWCTVFHGGKPYASRGTWDPKTRAVRHRRLQHEVLNVPQGTRLDHKNGNGLDCRKENLRPATAQENSRNRRKADGCLSQFKGVCLCRRTGRWRAYITIAGRMKSLGYYDSEIEAAHRYDAAACLYFGEFAAMNFPLHNEVGCLRAS